MARRAEIDRLIEQGKKLREIGQDESVKLSRERIRQYIDQTGQYNYWKEKKREKITARLQTRQVFCSLLEARANQLAEQKGWAYQKAWEYRSSLKYREGTIPFKSLLTLFRRYEKAREKGEKLSLEELAERLFSHASSVCRILQRVGLEPMYWTCERHLIHYEKKLAIARAARRLPRIPCPDIAYFLDLPKHVVTEHPAMKQKKRCQRNRFIKMFNREPGKGLGAEGALTYRLASQIYEAKDAGYTPLETVELLDTKPQIVQYAYQHKREIAPVIMRTLRVLHPHEKIKRPYRSSKG